MSAVRRWWEVARREVLSGLRRPAYWVLFVLLALLAWGFSEGGVTISSGDATIGGERAHITSMFGQGLIQTVLIMGFGAWFLAIAAGLVVIRDLELGVVELFHSTRLTPREYVWGKFAGALGIFIVVWLLYLCVAAGVNHIVEGGDAEHIGSFALVNYLYPTLLFGLPQILLFAGVPFFLGTWTRQPIVVFAFPVTILLFTLFFLTTWSPDWLSPETNRLLMLLDPSGFRWLNETFLTVDRGVAFYNSAPIQPDTGFLLSRAAFGVLGLAAVAGATRSYVGRLRRGGSDSRVARFFRRRRERREGSFATVEPAAASLRGLGMATRPLGFWRAAQAIGREEIRELIRRPGMYLFVPLILWQAILNSLFAIGPFNSQVLLTPGVMAARQLNTLALLICVLLLFYTVESLHKERGRQLAEIFNSTPIPTGSILLGKTIGNSVVAGLILVIGVIACAVVMLYRQLFQGSPVGFDIVPFVVTWGGVLVPTFIFWTALVTALFALFRNRYAVYAVGLFLIIFTAVRMTFLEPFGWVRNWMAWNAVQWTDLGTFSLNGRELLLNRILYLSLVPLLVFVAVKLFGRQDRDATRVLHRMRPRPILFGTPRVLAFAAPAIVLASVLFFGGRAGRQGEAAEEAGKDYWRENVATWTDFEMPSVSDVDVELDFEPAERSVAVEGEYTFHNHRDYAYEDIPVTAGQWDPIKWTLNGEAHEPDDRSNLFVFTPDEPLGPGDSLTIGFSYDLEFPRGMSREAGGAGQFILESGIVLTAFTPTFMPVPGYLDNIGVDDDNSSEPRTTPTTSTRAKPSRSSAGEGSPLPCARESRCRRNTRQTGWGRRSAMKWWTVGGRWSGRPIILWCYSTSWREIRGKGGRRDRDLLPPGARLQHRGDVRRARRRAQVLLRVVLSLPVGSAQDLGIRGFRDLCAGIPDQHHLQRGDRVPGQERSQIARGLHGGRARGCSPVVGQPADAGPGSGRQHPVGGNGSLLDDAAARAGLRRPLPDRVRKAAGAAVRRPALRGLGAPNGPDRRDPVRRRNGNL